MTCRASTDFKINCHRLSPCDRQIVLVEISHPFLTTVIRLAESKCTVISNGETYIPCAFDYSYHRDIDNELPKASLRITNIGKPIMRFIERSIGGKDGEITFHIIREGAPDEIEFTHVYKIAACSATLEDISIDLIVQNNFDLRGIRRVFDPEHAPGIF